MTVQTKKIVSDTGSAVVAETVNQLNRAVSFTKLVDLSGASDSDLVYFEEDVYILDVSFGLNGGNMDHADDDIILASGTAPDGTGGSAIASALGFNATALTGNEYHQLSDALNVADATAGSLPVRVDAGTSVELNVIVNAGSSFTGGTMNAITISYRPVKDELVLQPNNIPNKLRNWSVRDR